MKPSLRRAVKIQIGIIYYSGFLKGLFWGMLLGAGILLLILALLR